MMPKKIFIVRHGESFGNVDKTTYKNIPDYAIRLTPKGIEQAKEVGKNIKNKLEKGTSAIHYSPFLRTIETTNYIITEIRETINKQFIAENSLLREQEWYSTMPLSDFDRHAERDRLEFGVYFYRFPHGESCADVTDRISLYIMQLGMSFLHNEFPDNLIIVTHGMTMRVLLMRWFSVPFKEFQLWKNPHNCEMFELTYNNKTNIYDFDYTQLRKRTEYHKYTLDLNV